MTEEQLAFFTEQTRIISERALKRYQRRAVAGFLILFLASMANILYSNQVSTDAREQVVKSGDIVAVSGCNRDYEDRIAVRSVLVESKAFTKQAVKEGRLTKTEGDLRLDFYNARLEALPLPDCRTADEVLTDDPDKPLRVPEPLYPASSADIVPPVSSQGEGRP